MAIIGPFSPSEGLNTVASIFTIPSTQATDLNDAFPSYGNIINRGSVTKLNSSAITLSPGIIGLGAYIDAAQAFSSTNSPLIVAITSNSKIYTGPLTSGAITLTDRTGSVTIGNTGNPWNFAVLNNVLVMTGNSSNGDSPLQLTTYNGNVAALAGSPPKSDICYTVNNFMFLGKNLSSTATFSRIYWSNVADPQTWPAANFLDVRLNDGDMISGLSSIGQDLIIFKQRSISRLSTSTTTISGAVTLGPLATLSDSVGIAGQNAVDKLPDGRIIFLDSKFRLQIYDGYSFQDVSDQRMPGPSVRSVLASNQNYYENNSFVRVDALKNRVYLMYLDVSGNTRLLVYNFLENTWAKDQSTPLSGTGTATSIVVSPPTQGGPDLIARHLLMGTNNGFVYEMDGSSAPNDTSGATNQAKFTMSIQLPFDFIPRTLLIPATLQSGSLSVTLSYNGVAANAPVQITTSTNSSLWNLFDLRSASTTIPRPYSIQIAVSPPSGNTFTIYPMYLSDEVLSHVS